MGDKSPKQREKLNKQKRPAASVATGPKRVVPSPPNDPTLDRPFRFRFNRVDVGGPWCLTSITPEDHLQLISFMKQMEGLAVREVIDGHTGKREDVAGASPNDAAQRRARDMFLQDHERIHSLRVSGPKRIWGLQFENQFSVIWWDPGHDVWPTKRVTGN